MLRMRLILWLIAFSMQMLALGYAVRQFRHPFRYRQWQYAWGAMIVLILATSVRRILWLETLPASMAGHENIETVRTLLVSAVLLATNWCFAHILPMTWSFEAQPGASIVINSHSRILAWDACAEALFGWKASEVLGKDLADVIIPARFHAAHHQGIARVLAQAEGNRTRFRVYTTDALHRNHSEFPVQVEITTIEKPDKTIEFIGTVRKLVRV